MEKWLAAGLWGFLASSALLIGAAIAYFLRIPQRVVAATMAFGAGVLISALSLGLMDEAFRRGGFESTAIGFISGAAIYSLANWVLARYGAKHRKRSNRQPSEGDQPGSGMAIAVGALIDGIPESIVIGLSFLGSGVSGGFIAVVAIFLSNIPEGLSSVAGMKRAGRSAGYIFGVWTLIAFVSGAASLVGYWGFSHASPELVAAIIAVAAGAILAMLSDTMIPEAFEITHNFTGLITVAGFLTAFILAKLGA